MAVPNPGGIRFMEPDQRALIIGKQGFFPPDPYFYSYVSGAGQPYTTLATGTGASVTLTTTIGAGGVALASGTTAPGNDTGVISTNAWWLFQQFAAISATTYLQLTEASTNKSNIFFGFSSVAAAGLMTDGAMKTGSQSTFGFFKIDGQLNWNAFSQVGTTINSTACDQTTSGAAYQELRVDANSRDGLNMDITFMIGAGASGSSTSGSPSAWSPLTDNVQHKPFIHRVAISGAVAMKFVAGYVATGSGSNAETLNLGYSYAMQHRVNTLSF